MLRDPRTSFVVRPARAPSPWLKTAWQKEGDESIHLFTHRGNKLRVALAPKPSDDIVALSVVYTVGSKAETLGTTGSAHILEHELFKGSAKFNKKLGNDIWTALGDKGVRLNASTSKDRTEFNFTMRAELLDAALEIEADRLRAPLLVGLEKEYVVVRNEYERGKNSDASLLREEVYKAAFPMSSAGVPTIGSEQDINDILYKHAEDLRKFHKDNYCPANCVVVLSGQFDPDLVLAKIDACFADIPAGKSLREIDPNTGRDGTEAEHDVPQRGKRSVEIAGAMPIAILGFRAPPSGVCREAIALEVLSHWLSAGESGAFADLLGENADELHEIQAEYERCHGTGSLFSVWIVPVSGGDSRRRIRRLKSLVLARLRGDALMSSDELDKVKRAVDRAWRKERSSCSGYTQAIVESVSRSDSPMDVLERHNVLRSLTLREVLRTAGDVFVPWRLTAGKVIPDLSQHPMAEPSCTPYAARGNARDIPNVVRPEKHVVPYENAEVDESSVFVLDPRSTTLSLRVHIPSVDSACDAEYELAAALATLGVKLKDGRVLSEADLQKAYQQSGASAMVSGNHAGLDLSLDVPSNAANAGELVRLMRRGVTDPSVTARVFQRKRGFFQNESVGADFEVNTTAAKLFSQSIFHESRDPRARLAGVDESKLLKSVTRKAALSTLRGLASQPAWVTCVAPTQEQLDLVRSTFVAGGAPKHDAALRVPSRSPYASQIVKHDMPGKTSCTMLLGVACDVVPADERSLPLSLGVDILGGGFTSRLMQKVREDAGLTYGAYSSVGLVDPSTSTLSCSATFAPENVEEGVALSREVVKNWRERGVTQQELDSARARALGAVALATDSPAAVCSSLHASRLHHEHPAERCANLPGRIGDVTLEEVNAAISSLPNFGEFVCVLAGAVK